MLFRSTAVAGRRAPLVFAPGVGRFACLWTLEGDAPRPRDRRRLVLGAGRAVRVRRSAAEEKILVDRRRRVGLFLLFSRAAVGGRLRGWWALRTRLQLTRARVSFFGQTLHSYIFFFFEEKDPIIYSGHNSTNYKTVQQRKRNYRTDPATCTEHPGYPEEKQSNPAAARPRP